MLTDERNITENALHMIEDESDYLSSADDCLDFLHDASHFASLKEKLRAEISKCCKIENTDDNIPKMIDELTDRILALEEAFISKEQRTNYRKTVSSWINGKRKTIGRESAIKICFALNMNIEHADTFLRKGCGMAGFNVRNAKEVIWLYCIINHKPYSHSIELMRIYNELPVSENKAYSYSKYNSTTLLLVNRIKKTKWDSDDNFIKSVLQPYKPSFLNYSKTTVSIYWKYKFKLIYKLLSEELQPDKYTKIRFIYNGYTAMLPHFKKFVNDLQNEYKFWTENQNIIISDSYKTENSIYKRTIKALETLKELSLKYQYICEKSQKIKSIKEIYTAQILLNYVGNELPSISEIRKQMLKDYRINIQSKTLQAIVNKLVLLSFELSDSPEKEKAFDYVGLQRVLAEIIEFNNENILNFLSLLEKEFDLWKNTDIASIYSEPCNTINTQDELKKEWNRIIALCERYSYVNQQFNSALGMKTLLNNIFRSFLNDRIKNGTFKKNKSSINSLLDDFPRSQYLSKFETNPEQNTSKPFIRKTIILFFFFDYIYNWDPYKNDYYDFYINLSEILDSCGLASIYYADPFDWFILRSVREFEVQETDNNYNELYDPLQFFFDIMEELVSDDI